MFSVTDNRKYLKMAVTSFLSSKREKSKTRNTCCQEGNVLKDVMRMGTQPRPGGEDNTSSQSFTCWQIRGLLGVTQACLFWHRSQLGQEVFVLEDSGPFYEYKTALSPAGSRDSQGGRHSADPRCMQTGGETEAIARGNLCKPPSRSLGSLIHTFILPGKGLLLSSACLLCTSAVWGI